MKSKIKTFLTLMLIVVSVLCFATACAKANETAGEPYEFTFDKPFAGTPDSNMKIDGKLEEDAWSGKNWLTQTVKNKAWQVTTHFTAKGLYVGVKVTDDNMRYNTRFTSRSAVNVYLCKTGTETYEINSLAYHEARCFEFQLDPYYCRSKGRVPYYYKAHVEGELNSETTCTMTAELFLTWKDLYYTTEELNDQGYPDDIMLYANYNGESTEVLGTCLWREETYLHFNKDGLVSNVDSESLGSVRNGLSATDMWEKNESGNLQTTAGRAQILWYKNAFAKDFMFEARLKPLSKNANDEQISLRGERVSGRFGLINETANADYTVFSADARSVADRAAGSKQIKLQTCKQIDSFHWQNKIGLSQQTVQSDYADDSVTLRVIKQDDMFYYFYGDKYWKSERIASMSDSAYCGIFTSQGVEIEDCKFEDYSGKRDALIEKLSEYVYFVDATSTGAGSAGVSSYAVAKGEEVTVSLIPASQGVLTGLTLNGTDVYDSVTQNMTEECEYTFTPDGNVTFAAKFSSFDRAALVRTVIMFSDENGSQVKEGNYEIVSDGNKLLFYKGTPNSSGYVVLDIPKSGTYTVDGKVFEVSGTYLLDATFANYHGCADEFVLDDETTSTDINGKPESVAGTKSFTKKVTLRENAWGTVKVNGITVNGSGGTPKYNDETGNYYVENAGSIRYFKNTADGDFALDVKIDLTNVGSDVNDLAGFAVTNGRYVVIFKVALNNSDNLIVAAGGGTSDSSSELALNGFKWANTIVKPSGEQNNGKGSVQFRLVGCGNVLYLFDKTGEMRAYFNANGLNLVNGTRIAWGGENLNGVNTVLKNMLVRADGKAFGMRTYSYKAIRAEYDWSLSTDEEDIYTDAIGYGKLKVSADSNVAISDEYTLKTGYALGETVTIGIKTADENIEAKCIVTDNYGTRVIDGVYDYSSGCVVFGFVSRGGDTSAYVSIASSGKIEWSDAWGEFTPDRDNTFVE